MIDAGLSGARIAGELKSIGRDIRDIKGILITHEHDDHIKGAGILSRKLSIPLYCNEKTFEAALPKLGKISEKNICIIEGGKAFELNGVKVSPFKISHDAADPLGFRFSDGVNSCAVATDTGVVTEEILGALKGCSCAILEANHDVTMLMQGSYPWVLKERILGEKGHLSNESCAALCERLISWGMEHICLGHLSRENNTPMIALNTVANYLAQGGMKRGRDYTLQIAMRDCAADPVGEAE